jgi:hypothetical protein
LVENCLYNDKPHPPYAVHSRNPAGKENIISYINSYNNSRK